MQGDQSQPQGASTPASLGYATPKHADVWWKSIRPMGVLVIAAAHFALVAYLWGLTFGVSKNIPLQLLLYALAAPLILMDATLQMFSLDIGCPFGELHL